MAENEVVRTIRVRGVPEGLENLTNQLQRAEQAYSGVGAAASTSGAATETSARKLNTTERAYRSLTEKLDSTARVYRQLQQDTRTLSGAFDAGFMGKGAEAAARFNQELLQIRQSLQDVGGRMATGNTGLDKAFGIGALPGRSARESADVWDQQARTIQKLRQQYDPLGVAQERYATAIAETNDLLKSGQITEAQHVTITTNAQKVLDDTTKAYNGAFVAQGKYASGAGLARHELINLSRQIQDVGVSLAGGQAPLTVLIQQGTQIADIFAASRASVGSFFAQAARWTASFAMSGAGLATGGALVGAGAALAGHQYAESQREIERAMSGVGRQSGVTIAQINRLSGAYADAAKVSTSTAREMLAAYAGTGKIGAGLLPQTAGLTKDFAAQFSLSATDAAKQLAGAFVDPTRGAQELNKQIGFLDARTLEYIRTAQAQGRLGDAQKAMADALGQSLSGAADRTSGLAKAWNAVWNAASGAWDAVGKAVAGQTTAEERLNALIERRRNMEGGLRSRSASGQAAIGRLDDQISFAQEEIRMANRLAAQEAAAARARAASLPALSAVDELNPFGAELRRLETMASALKKGLDEAASALSPEQAERVREAYDRITAAIQAALPPAERQRQVNALNVDAVNARTLAERTAVEIARLQLDTAFKLKGTEEQRLIILGKINEAQAQANREARDAARSARDQLELAGLRPYQRRQRQIEMEQRDLRERIGGAAAAPYSFGAGGYTGQGPFLSQTRGWTKDEYLAAVRRFESNDQNVYQRVVGPNGGYNPSTGTVTGPSTASGYYQITNTTWRDIAKVAGIDLRQYPTAISAPRDLQDRAASALYDQRGTAPWSPYNAKLREWQAKRGDTSGTGNADLSKAGVDKQAANDLETYNSIIRSANDNLAAQQRQLQATRDTMFMSNEEVAKAQKFQELYSQAVQEGGSSLANALLPAIQKTAAGYGELTRLQEELKAAQDAWKTLGDVGKDFAGGFIRDLRAGKTAAEAFASSLERLADKILDLAMSDIGKMFNGNGGTGFFASMFRMFAGGGGSGGGAAMMSGTGGLYSSGGFTGAGGKHDPAGIVHRGEYVFSAASVGRIGLGNLDAMHRGAMKGYASGGHVGQTYSPAMPYVHPASNSNAGGNVAVSIINNGRAADVESAREVTDGNGGRRIEVVMKEQVGRALAEPGAASDTLRSNYGAKRRVASR